MNTELKSTNEKDSFFAADNLEHALKVAEIISNSEMTPKSYKNKPNDVLIAMELGRSWGLGPLQAIQNIAVINGTPSAYGDLVLAICSSHPDFEDISEEPTVKNGEIVAYTCTVKRKGRTPVVKPFTKEQAKKAGLWGRQGPWSQYPERMLQMRARAFALRDSFADALQGVGIREEVEDYNIKDVTPERKQEKSKNLKDRIKQAKDINVDSKTEDDKEKNNKQCDNETGEAASHEEIKALQIMISNKGFNNGRLTDAMNYYKVEKLADLTSHQVDNFMQQLNKLPDKEEA